MFEIVQGRLEKQPVTLGIIGDTVVEVTEGATAGKLYVKMPGVDTTTGSRVRARVLEY